MGVHSDFFALGGHSLLVVRLLTKVSETFGVDLPFDSLFDAGTLAAQAALIEGRQGQGLASAALDLEAEAQLELSLRPPFVLSWVESRSGAVMLTGATGFLGTYLLAELLTRTDDRIHCLVRAGDERRAYDKLQLGLERQGLWQAAWVHRIVPICGELAAPRLGLPEPTYAALARELGVIYHNAAQVNDVQPYRSLKPINVNGTREMIRLACAERPKALHYVSTVSVFGAHGAADGRAFEEKDFPAWPQWPDDGYGQSKWVAERMVRIVSARGLPVTVYRPGFIIGASRNGVWNIGDLLARIIHGCVALGLAPDREEWLDLAPVDYVARSLVHLSLHPAASGETYHLSNACKVSSLRLFAWIAAYGYPLQRVPYAVWVAAVRAASARDPDFPLAALLSALEDDVEETDGHGMEQRFDDAYTRARLAPDGVLCPPIDETLWRLYLDFFVTSGVLPPPEQMAMQS